jgi:ribosome-binding ATPase YchF (GTP1/OBG family)
MDRNRFFRSNYSSGIDYNSITNLDELRSARERLKNIIAIKEYELESNVNAFKEALNPVTYINKLLVKIYSFENLLKYFVKGYDFVRSWFNRDVAHSEEANGGMERCDAVDMVDEVGNGPVKG